MDPLLVNAGVEFGKDALKKAFSKIYTIGTGRIKKIAREIENERVLENVYINFSEVRMVKTFASREQSIDLGTFYCRPHIDLSGTRTQISSYSDFTPSKCVLISGIAGQGKSMLMRYLAVEELRHGTYIPLFAELRQIRNGETLVEFLIRCLARLGIELDQPSMIGLLSSGCLLPLLDAYDELPESSISAVTEEIDFLTTYLGNNVRMVISTRPEKGLEAARAFRVVKLCNLENDEYKPIITSIADDPELGVNLIERIEHHDGNVRTLLSTPLLVTLLVIQYTSYQQLPNQLSEFYDELFETLLYRHDGKKLGYIRPRKCKCDHIKCRKLFEAFCFYSKGLPSLDMGQQDVYKLVEQAIKKTKIEEDPHSFIEDIVHITCLLLRDGNEYRFIHKSVQEYYTASFVKDQAEAVSATFYSEIFSSLIAWQHFRQELKYLREIHSYCYWKFGILQAVLDMLSLDENSLEDISSRSSHRKLEMLLGKSMLYRVSSDSDIKYQMSLKAPLLQILAECDESNYIIGEILSEVTNNWPSGINPNSSFSILNLINLGIISHEAVVHVSTLAAGRLLVIAKNALLLIRQMETKIPIISLLSELRD